MKNGFGYYCERDGCLGVTVPKLQFVLPFWYQLMNSLGPTTFLLLKLAAKLNSFLNMP